MCKSLVTRSRVHLWYVASRIIGANARAVAVRERLKKGALSPSNTARFGTIAANRIGTAAAFAQNPVTMPFTVSLKKGASPPCTSLSPPTPFTVWLSADDTARWATAHHPTSAIRDRRVRALFNRTGLVDLAIDGGRGPRNPPADELTDLVHHFVAPVLPPDHPAWAVAID